MRVWDVDPTKSIGVYSLTLETGEQIDTEVFKIDKNRFFVHLQASSRTSWAVKGKRYPREIKLHLDQAKDTNKQLDQAKETDSTRLNVELLDLKCSQFFVLPSPSMCLVINQEPAFEYMDNNPAWIILKGQTPDEPSPPGGELLAGSGKANLREIVPPKSQRPITPTPKNLHISKRLPHDSNPEDSNPEAKSAPTISKTLFFWLKQVGLCIDLHFMNKHDLFYGLHIIFAELVTLVLFLVNLFACKEVSVRSDSCLRVDIILCLLMIGAKLFLHIVLTKCLRVRFHPRWIFSLFNIAILLNNGVTASRFSKGDKWRVQQKSLLALIIILNLFDFLYLWLDKPQS